MTRRRGQRGQTLIEFALAVGLLLTLSIGMFDLGRGFSMADEADAASRAGARAGATAQTSDVGLAVRTEPGTVSLDWGGLATVNCTAVAPGQACGDANGCASNSPFWSTGSPNACYAVRTCYVVSGACAASDAWAVSRPCYGTPFSPCWSHTFVQAGKNTTAYLQVRVVLKLSAATPFVGVSGLFVQRDAYAAPLY